MTTKVKTTATFTFTFESDSEEKAIRSLRSWFCETSDADVKLVKDSDTGEYTYFNTNPSVGNTFKFKTPAEFIKKLSAAESQFASARALLDYTDSECIAATVENIEVEEGK